MTYTWQQYEAIGGRYERTKQLPVGLAERATLLAALPDLSGKSVLDVGAGTGYYARLFRRRGAAQVFGVDASPEMIAYASHVEARESLGIEYLVGDAETLPKLGAFDMVAALWLLGYAESRTVLDRMLARLTANLARNGTLVVMLSNPDLDWERADIYPRYGLTMTRTVVSQGRQGYAVHVDGDPPIDFEGFAWPRGQTERALTGAGLVEVRRHAVSVPVGGLPDRSEDYWDDLRANPTFAVFTGCWPG